MRIASLIFFAIFIYTGNTLASPPERIVSLDLCSDWMLLTYARPGQVRAFSPYLYQFDADWVAGDLPTHDGSLEQVLALKADLVVSGEYNALLLRERLQQLGGNVQVLPNPRRLADLPGYIDAVERLVGSAQGQGDKALMLGEPHPSWGERLLLLGANGIAAGRDTLEHDIINAAGWRNYVQHEGFVGLELERLIDDPPDAIVLSSSRGQSLARRFASHPALRKRIMKTNWKAADDWRWTCPGPWTYRLIEELSAWKER